MTNGKKKCELLKAVRCKVAKENGINYTFTECTHQGECKGTCPKCEEELRCLTKEIEKLKQSGKRVAVAGVAAAVIGSTTIGCTPDGYELQGDIAAPVESEVVDGLIAPPEDDVVWMGDPAPAVPSLSEAVQDWRAGYTTWGITYHDRDVIHGEWGEYLTESGRDYDIYVLDGVQVKLIYDENGYFDSAVWPESPVVPPLKDTIALWREGAELGLEGYHRNKFRDSWVEYHTYDDGTVDLYVLTEEGVEIRVEYDEAGFSTVVTIREVEQPG